MKLLRNIKKFGKVSRTLRFDQLMKVSVQFALGTRLNRLSIPDLGHPLWWRGRKSDPRVISQIFVFGECNIDLAHPPDLIIDGGANVGYSAVFFAHKYPGVPIIAVEPDEENLKVLKLNCAPYPQVKSIQGAIWKTHSHLRIANPEAESWAFVVEEIPQAAPGSFEGYTIDELIGEAKNVLLKLDIEGAERVVFAQRPAWIDDVSALVIEVHGDDADQIVRRAMDASNYSFSRKGEKLMFQRANRHELSDRMTSAAAGTHDRPHLEQAHPRAERAS